MRFSSTLTGILGLAVTCAAQTTLPSNPQASEISTGLVAAAKSVTANPSWISLDSALNSALPSTVTDVPAYLSIINEYNGGPDGVNVALLTSSVSVATQSWESTLPSSLKSAYDGFETSFISEAQRVEATPLGITPGSPLPSSLFSSMSSPSSSSSQSSDKSSSSKSTDTTTSTALTSSLGSSGATAASSSAASTSTSKSSSAAGPTNAAWNAGLGVAVGVVGMAAAIL